MTPDTDRPAHYSDKLPRKVSRKVNKCQHLTGGGDKCNQYATWEVSVHFENGLYYNSPSTWAIIYFCNEHSPEDSKGIRHA